MPPSRSRLLPIPLQTLGLLASWRAASWAGSVLPLFPAAILGAGLCAYSAYRLTRTITRLRQSDP